MRRILRPAAFMLAVAGALPAAAGEPMQLVPLDLRPPAEAAPAPAPVQATRRVANAVPLPRPRPAEAPAAVASAETAPPAPVPQEPEEAMVDRSIETATIAQPAPPAAPEPVPAAPPPQAAPVAKTLPAPVVTAAAKVAEPDAAPADGLPGDPAAMEGAGMANGDVLAEAATAVGEPYQLVRTLQMLQDQVAQGSVPALAAQKALRTRIDAQFAAAAPAIWQDKRNADAAVTYVLSGGSPAILEQFLVMDPKPAVDQRLAGGALAYIQGHEGLANDLLGQLNPFDLPPSMGGQVALAQSALSVRTDPAKSMKLLDVARLLGTGTLVEEAALRREIFVADQLKQYDKVEVLARQYLERFRHSVYAGNFRNRFAAAVTHMDFVKDADQFKRLDNMVENVEPPARCQIYLTVALASVVRGNGLAARLAAERASALAENGSAEQSRAALYRAAGSAGDSKTFDDAAKALADVRSDQLSPSDQSLQEMVAAVVDGVAAGTKVLPKEQRQLAWTDGAAGDPATPMMKRANDALKVADTLLAANSQ